jgi:phage terminase large subunit-like protein
VAALGLAGDPSAWRLVVLAVPDPTPGNLPDPDAFKQWKPEAQARALEMLQEREHTPWRPFYCANPNCNGEPHGKWDFNHARKDQRPPKWAADWLYWLLSGGRGSGKTRTGSEVTHRVSEMTSRIILIAPTGPDLRETMIEGVSGIQATAPPGKMPVWEPSKKKLTWPNGCIGQGFSAEEPDRLRGPASGFIWCDEAAFYPDVQAVWDNMLFGFRVKGKKGFRPKVLATTTPKPTEWMRKLVKDPLTVIHRVSSYANIENLDEVYRQVIIPKYEGTRLGRQELHGELLEDVEGALWHWEMIQWIADHPPLERIVVGVDPAGSANKRSDETGILSVGIGFDGNYYVLDDSTGTYSPGVWADKAVGRYEEYRADAIVPEKNYGGDMVKHTLENSRMAKGLGPRIIPVESRRGKALRAEPIVALYEKGKVFHVGARGDLGKLEEELTSWVPGEGPSPNRVDALVHAITELAKKSAPAQISDPNKLLAQYRSPTNRHLRVV